MIRKTAIYVVVLCLVTTGAVGPALTGTVAADAATGQSGPPSGMVGIPDSNVDDLRSEYVRGESGLSTDDLAGAVYVSDHAETTHVSIVSPEQATAVGNGASPSEAAQSAVCSSPAAGKNPNFDCEVPDDYGLVLTDNEFESGREVAIRAGVVEETLGYIPERLTIANNETGETWTSTASVEDGWLTADVEHFSSNAVTFSGKVDVSMEGATNGSSTSYQIGALDAVDNFVASLEGVLSTESESETIGPTTDDSTPVSVAGNLEPGGPESGEPAVTFEGSKELYGETWSGVDGDTISVSGDEAARNGEVTFTGAESTSAATYSATGEADGDTTDISVDGNVPAENAEVTFTGVKTSGTQTTVSGSSGDSVNPDGNADPVGPATNNEPEVTFIGQESRDTKSYSDSGVSLPQTQSVDVTGNVGPEGPSGASDAQVSITANAVENTYNPAIDEGNGGGDQYEYFAGFDGDASPITSSIQIQPKNSGTIENITVEDLDFSSAGSDLTVDVFIQQSGPTASGKQSDASLIRDDWEIDISDSSVQTIDLATTPQVNAGEYYDIVFVTQDDSAASSWNYVDIGTDYSSGDAWYFDRGSTQDNFADMSVAIESTVGDVSVSDNTGTSTSFGDFTAGETKTRSLDLSTGSNEVTLSGSGTGTVDYSVEYVDVTASEDPAVDIIGDGNSNAGTSGILRQGETASVQLAALTTGTQTVDTTLTESGPSPDWEITYAPGTKTEDPGVDIDGDGSPEASYDGTLNDGETATVNIGTISEGAQTVTTDLTVGEVDWEISATEVTATQYPAVDFDGDGSSEGDESAILRDGETTTVPLSEDIPTGTHTIDVATNAGPDPDWEITADRVEYARDIAFDLDDDGTPEITESGPLGPGETATASVPGLTTDTGTIGLTAQDAPATATLEFVERVETNDAQLVVNGNRTGETGRLNDGASTNLSVSESWVREGENTVELEYPDQSDDAPPMQATLDYSHEASVTHSIVYNASAWRESYNVSKTFAGERTDASVTIPFEGTVFDVISLGYQVNDSGEWIAASSDTYSLDNTTLTADLTAMYDDDIPANTTIDVRTTGRKVQVTGGDIQVVEPTPLTDARLDTKVQVTDSPSDTPLLIETSDTQFGSQIHYAYNESWVIGDQHTEITQDSQTLVLPDAETADSMRISTIPVAAEPVMPSGDVVISVANAQTTEPAFEVRPGEREGDAVEFTYLSPNDGRDYVLYSETDGVVLDSGTADGPLTLEGRDTAGEMQFQLEESTSGGDGGNESGMLGPIDGPQPAEEVVNVDTSGIPLAILVGGGLLLIGVLYWRGGTAEIQQAGQTVAGSIAGTARWGANGLSSTSSWLAGRPYIAAVGVAVVAIALIATGTVSLPGGAGVFLLVVGTPAAAYVILVQRFGVSRLVWGIITAVALLLGFQLLGTDVFSVVASSQAFPILAAGGVYLAYRALQAYQAEASAPDEQITFEVDTNGGDD